MYCPQQLLQHRFLYYVYLGGETGCELAHAAGAEERDFLAEEGGEEYFSETPGEVLADVDEAKCAKDDYGKFGDREVDEVEVSWVRVVLIGAAPIC